MKKLLFIASLCLIGFSGHAVAQSEAPVDTMQRHHVMLIPYDERYYLSDADRDISESSKAEPQHFRNYFRFQVDRTVQRYINPSYPCISLLNDTTDELEETMQQIMSRTGYRYEKAIPVTPKIKDAEKPDFKLKNYDGKNHTDSKTASMYIPVKKDALYMQAIVKNSDDLFMKLHQKYDVDYFVFLTQFEIKTNYSSCMDIANRIFRREVMLHFTVYDYQGKIVAGSYATAYIPSDKSQTNHIAGECFPELAKYLAGCLP